MGRGSYKASDWAKLRGSISKTEKAEDIFANRISAGSLKNDTVSEMTKGCMSGRESRDSEDSPESTPVIIGFDVTASMGYLAKELALNAMNSVITYLYDEKPISNPQILCAAIGDSRADKYPLQVTQFESDIRIIKQLLNLYLEGGGGGNGGESYNLLWYFAAKHTAADCFDKRGRKGYPFTIGDDASLGSLSPAEINRIFNDKSPYVLYDEELLREAEKNYNVFHIHIENTQADSDKIFARWRELMPGRVTVIEKKDIKYLSEIICAIINVAEGKTSNETLKAMNNQETAEKIAGSLAYIEEKKSEEAIVF